MGYHRFRWYATLGMLSIMPKIPEISVGIQMERSVSFSSDQNIRNNLLPVSLA